MSEQDNAAAAGQAQFGMHKIYVKDVSFEAPNSPAVFAGEWRPDADIKLNTGASDLGEGRYEVVLTATVTLKVGEQVAFLVEVAQAGLFQITGVPKEQLGPVLGIHCPTILYPYAREAVSDLIGKGGFPQLLLAPVDFQSLYMQQAGRGAQAGSPAASGAGTEGNPAG
ncbi:MAG: protein-export chaperone SecB [Gammaproteobacteria bacterium]|nr:protein-export chaperone SecB [Gammaproteobacteria bacterium]